MQLPAFNVSQLPPIPTETFAQNYTLQVGNQTFDLVIMAITTRKATFSSMLPHIKRYASRYYISRMGSISTFSAVEDVFGYIKAHDTALDYDFDTFVGGHLTRLGTRDDVQIQREFITDLINASIEANSNVTFSEKYRRLDQLTTFGRIFKTY